MMNQVTSAACRGYMKVVGLGPRVFVSMMVYIPVVAILVLSSGSLFLLCTKLGKFVIDRVEGSMDFKHEASCNLDRCITYHITLNVYFTNIYCCSF